MADELPDVRDGIAALLPRLRRFGRALTGNRDDADDLVQIAVERALTRSALWTPGTRLDSWLFRIMQNAWIDEVRARARRPQPLDADTPEAAPPDAHTAADAPLEALAVRAAVARLGEDQRAAVALVVVEGLSYREAADVLGIPIGTLTSRLARARETLQALLDAPGAPR